MSPLAGLNKIVAIALVVVLVGISQVFTTDDYKQTCLGNNYVLTFITPTIQTIAFYSKKYGGKHSLLRGRIELIAVSDEFVAGYLSTRFFNEDGLIDLAGENDKEGFYIVRKVDGKVISGISGSLFFRLIDKQYHRKLIDFIKPEEVVEFGDCQQRKIERK